MYPGIYQYSLCVGSVDSKVHLNSFSSAENDSLIDCVSAGSEICSLHNLENNEFIYSIKSGTSMATPQMTGIVSLIIDGIWKKFFPYDQIDNVILRQITMLVHDYILFNGKYYSKDTDNFNNIKFGCENYHNGNCGRGVLLLDVIIDELLRHKSFDEYINYIVNNIPKPTNVSVINKPTNNSTNNLTGSVVDKKKTLDDPANFFNYF
jgi:hypothetical protein